MERHLLMSEKERKRKGVFEVVRNSGWSLMKAAEHLQISYRQCRRSYQRYVAEGDEGLVHRSRGRRSNRRKEGRIRQAILNRYDARYEGFGPTLAAEKLGEEGYEVDHETLRRWLIEEGKWQRERKRSPYRQRRKRREHFGELVQMDGSFHHWFGEGLAESCLIKLIDDATGIRMALMAEQETTEGCMRALWGWIKRYGLPKALYTDKKNVFLTEREATLEEQLAGEEPKTAFGKACAKLDIEIITANSPQAKGRVERAHGVNQDRLVKELQLQGVTTIAETNLLLEGRFMDELSEKFGVLAASELDYHRPVPPGMKLAEVFCFEESRVIGNDWVVRYHNRLLQIDKRSHQLARPKAKVIVQRLLDGQIRILHQAQPLAYREIESIPKKPATEQRDSATQTTPPRITRSPAPDHPWRQRQPYISGRAIIPSQC